MAARSSDCLAQPQLRVAQFTEHADVYGFQTEIGRVTDELNGAIDELREIFRAA